jgi:hypothetical protein
MLKGTYAGGDAVSFTRCCSWRGIASDVHDRPSFTVRASSTQVPARQCDPDNIQPSPEAMKDTDTSDVVVAAEPTSGSVATIATTVATHAPIATTEDTTPLANFVPDFLTSSVSPTPRVDVRAGHNRGGGLVAFSRDQST